MTRHPEPEIVTLYRQAIRQAPPRCCHTCDHYTDAGGCLEFDTEPPELFARTVGVCDLWTEELPF
jgi:hypothetical protein